MLPPICYFCKWVPCSEDCLPRLCYQRRRFQQLVERKKSGKDQPPLLGTTFAPHNTRPQLRRRGEYRKLSTAAEGVPRMDGSLALSPTSTDASSSSGMSRKSTITIKDDDEGTAHLKEEMAAWRKSFHETKHERWSMQQWYEMKEKVEEMQERTRRREFEKSSKRKNFLSRLWDGMANNLI
ncbi:hypothetical protein BT69DRAFT_1380223 [Atractiella rhizophila]|nr:hypothetical protein BT69DRAFT_1380223 [Atractiella rhizophila]